MISFSFEKWRQELLLAGEIIQDGDASVAASVAEAQFNRYVEMLDEIQGTEGDRYAIAIMESIQSAHDYGAYQAAQHALLRFRPPAFAIALLHQLPRLISDLPDWAGDFLSFVANSGEAGHSDPLIRAFNRALREADADLRASIEGYIREQEEADGWLSHKKGVLRAA